jgi:hypothetical protein
MNGEEKRSQEHRQALEFERAAERRSPGLISLIFYKLIWSDKHSSFSIFLDFVLLFRF